MPRFLVPPLSILLCTGCASPTLTLTHVPEYGDTSGVLKGRVDGPLPYWAYATTVHLEVAGQHWGKPYADSLLTFLQPDGTFEVDVTTGGVDHLASRFVVCIVSPRFEPGLHQPPNPSDALLCVTVERTSPDARVLRRSTWRAPGAGS